MNDTHHDIMFIIPVINRFMGAHVKVSGVAEHRPAGRLKTTTRLDAWWITPTANPPYELIEADGRPSASIMYRRVAAQNTNADRLTAAPSTQTPCQPAWA
jgi:hypothetical protein